MPDWCDKHDRTYDPADGCPRCNDERPQEYDGEMVKLADISCEELNERDS